MTRYDMLCAIVGNHDPLVESIDKPIRDWVQDAWLKGIEYLSRKGELYQAADTAELYNAYVHHAGLFATLYEQARINQYRTLYGVTEREADLLSKVFTLDGQADDGTAYAEIIEDVRATLPFVHVEDFDLVLNDERIKALDDKQQAAVKRFAVAWMLTEAGYSLPTYVRVRLTRDRKLTGLALRLDRRGRVW